MDPGPDQTGGHLPERGRELREFIERVLGPEGMRRAVVVTATSDQSALIRRRSAWAAMAVAEVLHPKIPFQAGRHGRELGRSCSRNSDFIFCINAPHTILHILN